MKNKLIQQRLKDDCGIAALAMLYDVPYQFVRNIILTDRDTWDGTSEDHAKALGLILGDPLRVWRVTDANRKYLASDIRGRSCVLIVPANDKSADLHAVYWTGYKLLDPAPQGKYGQRGIKALKTFKEVWIPESEAE